MFDERRLDERRPDTRQVPAFGVTLLLAAIALGVVAWRRGEASALLIVGAVIFTSVGIFALAAPRRALPIYRAWMALGSALGRVTTPIVLTLVFLLVFTPIRLLLVLLRRDPLERRWDPSRRTYFHERPRRGFDRGDFERLS